jgi:hypothetical protein
MIYFISALIFSAVCIAALLPSVSVFFSVDPEKKLSEVSESTDGGSFPICQYFQEDPSLFLSGYVKDGAKKCLCQRLFLSLSGVKGT